MALTDLKRVEQRTLCDDAADRLRDAIRNGRLRPGARLVERDLADQLADPLHAIDRVAHATLGLLRLAAAVLDLLQGRFSEALDLASGACRALGQRTHFLRHGGQSTSP